MKFQVLSFSVALSTLVGSVVHTMNILANNNNLNNGGINNNNCGGRLPLPQEEEILRRVSDVSAVTTDPVGTTTTTGATSTVKNLDHASAAASAPIIEEEQQQTQTREKRRPSNVVVVGAIRNNAKHFDAMKNTIKREILFNTKANFNLVRLVFFENDSTDGSLQQIRAWNTTNDTEFKGIVDVISEPNNSPFRTKRIAYARNRIHNHLQHLQESGQGLHIDYVLSLDMDTVNTNLQHVEECLSLPEDWAVCCANQYETYYDLWALRTFDDWTDCDVMIPGRNDSCPMIPANKRQPKRGFLPKEIVTSRIRHLPASTPPFKVKSCFGGAALMDFQKIKTLVEPYNGYTCEHVSFNQAVLDKNHSIYIQPKMLNDGSDETYQPNDPATQHRLDEEIMASKNDPTFGHYYKMPSPVNNIETQQAPPA